MFGASLTVKVTVHGLDRAGLEALFHGLGSHLIERQGEGASLLDHSVAADLGSSSFEISVTTAGKTADEANAMADFYIRDVLKATGGNPTDVAKKFRATPSPVALASDEAAGIEVLERELVAV